MGILDNFTPEQIRQIREELKSAESTDKEFVLRDIDEKYRKGEFTKIGKHGTGNNCSYELWTTVLQIADYITKNFADKERSRIYRHRDIRVPVDTYKATVRSLCESIMKIWEEYGQKE